jgi:O-antigen ligase
MKLDLARNKFNKHINGLVCYQIFLALGTIFIFFTELCDYLSDIKLGPDPVLCFYGFAVIALPLYFSISSRIKYLSYPLIIWCCIYLAIGCLTIVLVGVDVHSESPIQPLRDRIRDVLFFLLMLVIFSKYSIVQLWTKRAILLVTFFNVFINFYQLFNPSAFPVKYHEDSSVYASDRAFGFYGNPNSAGFALILCIILSVDLLEPKYRFLLILLGGLGILPTFSRGSMICWFLTVITLIITKIIPRSQVSYIGLSLITILLILGLQLNNLSSLRGSDGLPLLTQDMQDRIAWIVNPFSSKSQNLDNNSRGSLVQQSWQKFAEKPFLGNGLDSTKTQFSVGLAQDTHNMYLKFMVEHGFLGVFIYPLLILATIWKARGETKKIGIVFATNLLVWGFFNHTVIRDFSNLVAFGLMACMVKQSQLEQPSESLKIGEASAKTQTAKRSD